MNYSHDSIGRRPRDILHVLFKHQKKILFTFFGVMCLVLAVTFISTPVYSSTASLLVKAGREYRAKPDAGGGPDQMVVDRQEIINSEIEIISNKELIGNVIRSLGLDYLYPGWSEKAAPGRAVPSAAILKFMKALQVQGVPKSNIISLRFENTNPVIAARALTVLIEKFREKHLEVYSDPVSPVLKKQLADYAVRLKASEDALEAFRQQNRIYTIADQRNLLLGQQVGLDTSVKQLMAERESLAQKVTFARGQLKEIAKNASRYTQTEREKIVVDAQTRLLGLRLKEQELSSRDYRNDSVALGSIRKEIELVETFLANQELDIARKTRTANPVYQQVETEMLKAESDLASKDKGLAALRRSLEDVAGNIQKLDEGSNRLHSLERDVEINEKNYRSYLEKYEDARISADLNQQKIANISVVQSPDVSDKPVRPRKALNLVVGTLMAAVTALFVALIAEYFSQTFSRPDQMARKLDLPVLATLRRQA